jgi:prepilin-type N-terminal cleavage/methylation domain-containing protein
MNAHLSRRSVRASNAGFTLVELLVSISLLVILLLLVSRLMDGASKITTTDTKRIDADTEGRRVLDRIGIDINNMVKRPDVDYWLKSATGTYYTNKQGHTIGKGHTTTAGFQGSDQIAFYCQADGYRATSSTSGDNSPISLVAYRINANYQMERMGKNLLWTGVSNTNGANSTQPILYSPTVPFPSALSIAGNWPAATNTNADPDYEVIGPNVLRFEYYYLLKKGAPSDTPWDTDSTLTPLHTSVNGFTDVQAIAVAIAVIDPKSRSLLSTQNLIDLEANFIDFKDASTKPGNSGKKIGDVEYQWGVAINGNTAGVPVAANQAIRVHSRVYNLQVP